MEKKVKVMRMARGEYTARIYEGSRQNLILKDGVYRIVYEPSLKSWRVWWFGPYTQTWMGPWDYVRKREALNDIRKWVKNEEGR